MILLKKINKLIIKEVSYYTTSEDIDTNSYVVPCYLCDISQFCDEYTWKHRITICRKFSLIHSKTYFKKYEKNNK